MDSEILDSTHSIIEIDIPNPQLRIQEYNEIATETSKIHASFLFYRDKIHEDIIPQLCYKIYVSLVKRIGGTNESLISHGWKDFGYQLGVSAEELNYVENSMKTCPTDVVLKIFSQDEAASFKIIIEALLNLNRLDVIEGIYDPLKNLSKELKNKLENEVDHGYYSNSTNSENQTIKPKCFINNLPEVLQRNKFKNKIAETYKSENNPLLMPTLNKPSVLLTYFEDGLKTVENILNIFEYNIVNNKKIQVICLENIKSTILTNPEYYIRYYFEQVEYVIPILTEGYFKAIQSPSPICSSSLDNIDCIYTRFIYTLMSSHYINGTGCLNRKVRAVLSKNTSKSVLTELYKYPILSVWIREDEVNKLINLLF